MSVDKLEESIANERTELGYFKFKMGFQARIKGKIEAKLRETDELEPVNKQS